jgi:hypothetical protein
VLSPLEFIAGTLGNAGEGLTLLLPSRKYDWPVLVVGAADARQGVILEGPHAFVVFDCRSNKASQGLLIPGVAIEVDETCIIDLDRHDPPFGIVVRTQVELSIAGKMESGFRTARSLPLVQSLPEGAVNSHAGFCKWQIVVGSGTDKRVLKRIDIPRPSED